MTYEEALLVLLTREWVTTRHYQVAGDYEGETLSKLYSPGNPSYLAMLREDGKLISLKRDAMVIYEGGPAR